MTDFRQIYGLPERYFLSLGRMVAKKNLATLVAAYGRYCDNWRVTSDGKGRQSLASLVLVGSGELEDELEAQARALGLEVIDRRSADISESCHLSPVTCHLEQHGTVLFYGFRQIEENPVFYALAEAFILPSLYEEWGLVVNEAMAAGLPVIVSRTAGCAEDLLPASGQVTKGRDERPRSSVPETPDDLADRPYLEARSNGFVFDPTSVEALAEALKHLAASEDARKAMGQSSREIIGRWGCDNFARQALRAAQAAS
jgi:glycosyltransferase involved in cell wall biosynthesis